MCVRACVRACVRVCVCVCVSTPICCWHPLDFVRSLLPTGEHMQGCREVLVAAPEKNVRVTAVHRRSTHTDDATAKRLCTGSRREDTSSTYVHTTGNKATSHMCEQSTPTKMKKHSNKTEFIDLMVGANAV